MRDKNVLGELLRRYSSSWFVIRLFSQAMFWGNWLLWLQGRRGYELAKRILDIVISSLSLVFLSPLMLFLAIAIKVTDRGPILYTHQRIGRWGEPFRCPKFRSMIVNADKILGEIRDLNDHGQSVTFKMKRDPRITRIGAFMRKLSLDELPQLWSVLAGHMSLVGPRPALPDEVEAYSLHQRRRLDVRPGITCIWQVSGRGDIPFERQAEMDIEYIERQTLRTDIVLLFRTIPAVLGGRGAY